MVPESFHQIIGRYALFDEIASGGMATVHIGRLLGAVGFSRTVAIKRLHPQFAKDPEFVDMFVDEARLAARIRHPNVVPTLDVVKTEDELFLVMEYVQGESFSRLLRLARRRGRPLPVELVVPVIAAMLHGLHAAHQARGERGEALHIVHRDVSPQNLLVGTDGVPRVFDFGIAKARGRLQTTREGQIKGKLAYMAPEQLSGGEVGPETDIYAAAVVMWEALSNRRLFEADNEALLLAAVLHGARHPPSDFNPAVPKELDALVMRALDMDPRARFESARAMARALEEVVPNASATEIGEWVEELATDSLDQRAGRIAEIESQSEIKAFAPGVAETRVSRSSLSEITDPPSAASSSQLSSISVAGSAHRERPVRGTNLLIGAVALIAGGGMAALFLRPPSADGVVAGAPPASAPTPAVAAPSARSAPSASASPSLAASASPSFAASVTPAPSVRPPSPPRAIANPARPSPAPTPAEPPPPAPKKTCAWKQVFNPDGTHSYKEVCE